MPDQTEAVEMWKCALNGKTEGAAVEATGQESK